MTASNEIAIRPATRHDLPVLGTLGATLMRVHYAFDPERFIKPASDAEAGYAWFLGTQLRDSHATVLVAEDPASHDILGYVYAALEPLSWKELRDAAGFIHDIVVTEAHRRSGVASALLEAAIQWLRDKGAPRVILGTAERNDAAQRLFAAHGFRRTMIEMTREL
jgi:ribosomal protein S18 acetylase RimI-like enzyme